MNREQIEQVVEEVRGMYMSKELAAILVDELERKLKAQADQNAKLIAALNRLACWGLIGTGNEQAWSLVCIARDTLTKLGLRQ